MTKKGKGTTPKTTGCDLLWWQNPRKHHQSFENEKQ